MEFPRQYFASEVRNAASEKHIEERLQECRLRIQNLLRHITNNWRSDKAGPDVQTLNTIDRTLPSIKDDRDLQKAEHKVRELEAQYMYLQ